MAQSFGFQLLTTPSDLKIDQDEVYKYIQADNMRIYFVDMDYW